MSKSMIEAFAKGQMNMLSESDNKGRLKYVVAGCKDGHLYGLSGIDYGMYNADAPDTVFIEEADLELQRITAVKITSIIEKADAFFAEYGSKKVIKETDEVEAVEEDTEVLIEAEDVKTSKKEKKAKESLVDDEIDLEAVEKAVKKAIKKEDFKKAEKLIAKLPEGELATKLIKKLKKAM